MVEETIGPYRVVAAVGEGGMGTVVQGRHASTGEIAAIKTLPPADVTNIGFIRREIHALAQVRHPGIVRILDHGVERGVPWYAMEYVEGLTLRQFRERLVEQLSPRSGRGRTAHGTGAGPEQTAPTQVSVHAPVRSIDEDPAAVAVLEPLLTAVCRLCDALAYLHGEGLVHRDLKPDNIIVRPDGAPILVDFGVISRFPGDVGREVLELDHPTAGTILYMAPEQIAGDRVDARADLYALGCMLFQMITGRSPFQGFNYDAIARQHLMTAPLLPSSLAPGLPGGLDVLVLRLLAKRPQDRLGYASDVATALVELGARPPPIALGPPPRTYLYLPRFVGRELELDALRRSWQESERGCLLLVGGESGIGKTRLLLEFGREAKRDRAIVLDGSGVAPGGGTDGGRTPLSALHNVLRFIADRCRERGSIDHNAQLAAWIKVLAAYDSALAALPGLERTPEPAELPPAAARTRLYSYLAELIGAVADGARVCLLLDDLQWADELTLGFLEHLVSAGQLDRLALVVVAAYRTEETPEALARVRDQRGVHHLDLERVGEEAVGAIVGDMIGRGVTPAAFVEFLSAQSEGNPFFVAEYVRTAVAEGVLYRDAGGRWQLAGAGASGSADDYSRLPLPRSLAELVGRRLATLSADGFALTEVASALGRSFSTELLADVAGMGEERFWSALEEIIARQILEEEASGELRFVHDQIRSAAYAHVDLARRRRFHRAAALAHETRGGEADPEVAGILGHHWEQAGDAARARKFYLVAARHAAARHAQVQSATAYRAYLALVDQPGAESIAARIELGRDVLIVRADVPEALAELERALDEARALGSKTLEAQALSGLAKVHWRTSDMAGTQQRAAEATEIARQLGDTEGVANASERLAAVAWRQGRIEEALAICGDVLAVRRAVGDEPPLAITLGNMGAILLLAERDDEAVAVLREAIAIHRKATTPTMSLGGVLNNLAVAAMRSGQIEEAISLLEQAREVLAQIGDRFTEPSPLVELAMLYRRAIYDRVVAERYLAQAEAVGGSVGDAVSRILCLCERAHHALLAGASAQAEVDRVRELVTLLGAAPTSEPGAALQRIERAQTAHLRGEPLFRGECAPDIPGGIRRWLQRRNEWPDGA